MVALASGERQALARLYDSYAPRLLALGTRMLRDQGEAEDLLHDVFVEAWRHAGDYDPSRGTVRTWFFLRMRSRCLDRLRSAGYSRVRPAGDELERTLGGESLSTMLAEDGGRLRDAILELPAEQRAVLLLGYFEGLSSSEMATRLEVPIGTIKSRVHAAMAKLRARLRPAEILP